MGQKTHPKGFRLGLVETWDSTWFTNKKQYGNYLIEDIRIRKFLEKRYEAFGGVPGFSNP